MRSKKVPVESPSADVALGFDMDVDWSTATSRKRRRAKKGEDENDEDYAAPETPKPVNEDGVAKIMSSLLQTRERWVVIKLLTRLQVCLGGMGLI
jgi:[histone H3]-lysine36 N-trimethyltransferase